MTPFDETMQTTPMKSDLLLFVGAGVLVGSIFLGVAIGLIYVLRGNIREFRYGVFYSVFASVASIGFCLSSIAFYFQYLSFNIAVFCSLLAVGFLGGLSLLAAFVRKDNRVLFGILSIYCLAVIWLVPVFIWNMIYLFAVARRRRTGSDQSLDATSATRAP
jgi:hypothetical protein